MSQTTVNAGGQAAGIAGQLADNGEGRDLVSGFNVEATAQVPFGFGIRVDSGGAGDGYLIATGFSTVVPVDGVNAFSLYHNRAGNADPSGNFSGDFGASGLLPKAALQVLRRGRIYAPVEANVRPNDRAWCRGIGTGTLTPGIWAGSGYGGSYHVDCRNQGVFRTSTFTAADGSTKIAVLDFDAINRPV